MQGKVSFIIPIYKGRKYIENLLGMLERNWQEVNRRFKCEIEVVFVNDYPEERLNINRRTERSIRVRVLQSNRNRGIHGARVLGLKQSQGEYVVFLDQDDIIQDNFLASQFEHLEDGDAVICNGLYDNGRTIYPSALFQECVLKKSTYLWITNMIVSPGQVLIRKAAIPPEWTKYKMQCNGADDYFLWILMVWGKCKLRINRNILYEHVEHAENTSSDTVSMKNSEEELLSNVKKAKKLNIFEYWLLKRQIIWITSTQGAFQRRNMDLFYVRKWFVEKIMSKVD